jgi:hypothetical protein
MGEVVKNIFNKAINTAEGLLEKGAESVIAFFHNRSSFTDAKAVHGFYRLETPSGRPLAFRHHCPVSGDWDVSPPIKGSVVVHCPERKRDVFDPDAAMPTVVRYTTERNGIARLSDGSRVVNTEAGEVSGEFEYEQSNPPWL